ncbi:MAG: DUF2807 domain-containing protein [Ferruginibacter sp.]|nr:DUF2807 domain-containing protein [Cytophagales bacterium]
MKTSVVFLFLVLGAFWAPLGFAQPAREVPVGDFRKLTLQGNLRVELTGGDQAQVQVFGTPAELDEVTVSASGKELTLKTNYTDGLFEKDQANRRRPIRVLITYVALTGLHTGRGAEVRFQSVVTADDLAVEVHSGSRLKMDVQATSLRLEVGEGGQANVSGRATVQKTTVSTGGELNAEDLESEVVNIRANTGAVAQVSASKSIDASAGTGGSIRYRGRPAKRAINTTLGGSVNQL